MPDPALERMQGAGMRAGICNAMPLAGVQAWVGYMREFERSHA
jgi:phosphoserine aminotransferase